MDEYLLKRNRDNLIDFYNEELCKIYHGGTSTSLFSNEVRDRMKTYGILERIRGKGVVLTAMGKKLLKPYKTARIAFKLLNTI